MNVRIEKADGSRREEVSQILQEAAGWLEEQGEPMWKVGELDPARISREVESGLYFVALCCGEVAGVFRLQWEDELFWPDVASGDSAFLHRLAVRRRFAGQGVAAAMIDHARNLARQHGKRYLRLDCEAGREKLCAFYEEEGFERHSLREVGPYRVARYQWDGQSAGEPMGKKGTWSLRPANQEDISQLEDLITRSVRVLQADCYTAAQREGALGTVFAVDSKLIEDGTYLVVEWGGSLVGCGGWSRRGTLFGGDREASKDDRLLDPKTESARIRAFFVDPEFARRGIGTAILHRCEREIRAAGFAAVRIVATLPGEALYARFGYQVRRRYDLDLPNGEKLPAVEMAKELRSEVASPFVSG